MRHPCRQRGLVRLSAILLAIAGVGFPGRAGGAVSLEESRSPAPAAALLVVNLRGTANANHFNYPPEGRLLAYSGGTFTAVTRNPYYPEFSLTPSPDGRQVAFDQGGPVWIVNRNGTGLRKFVKPPLTPHGHYPYSINGVSWSPRGDLLAYNVFRDSDMQPLPGTFPLGTWIAGIRGTPPPHRIFTPNGGFPGVDGGISWSPDGRTVAINTMIESGPKGSGPVTPEIVAIDVVTGRSRILARGAPFVPSSLPQFMGMLAPVTGSLAYTTAPKRKGGPVVLWVAGGDGRHPHAVASVRESITGLGWSPDGRSLFYVTGFAGQFDRHATMSLWVVGAASRSPRRIVLTHGPLSSPRWSPNGTSIAYIGGSYACGCYMHGYDAGTALYNVDVATGRSQSIVRPGQKPGFPFLSPPHFTNLAWLR